METSVLELLKSWFEELGPWYAKWEDVVQEIAGKHVSYWPEDVVDGAEIHLFTVNHRYRIAAYRTPTRTYLGCLLDARDRAKGSYDGGGRDLPDGALTKETWDDIVHAMLAFELLHVHPA